MELLIEIYIVNCLGSADNSFYALLIKEERVDWIVKVHPDETGIGLALEDVDVMIPEVNVAITWPDDGSLLIAFKVYYFPATNILPPDYLEITISDDNEFSFWRTTQKILTLLIS